MTTEAIRFFTGDVGLAYSFISDLKDNGDGTYDVTVELRGTVEDDLIASGVFTIEENDVCFKP